MSNTVATPTPHPATTQPPPFVTVSKTTEGLTLQTNLQEKFLVLALLEGAKYTLLQPEKTLVQRPGMNGLKARMGLH